MDEDALRQHVKRVEQYQAARRLREEIHQLEARWSVFNLPTQALLKLLARDYGVIAATIATDALDAQLRSVPQLTGGVSASISSLTPRERCIRPHIV